MVVQRRLVPFWALFAAFLLFAAAENTFGVRDNLHFSLESRNTNTDGSVPIYKDPNAPIEDRVNDLLPRMTLEEKVSQLIQGDLNGWMDLTDPLDDTLVFNETGLEEMMRLKGGSIWAGYLTPYEKLVFAINVGQHYLMENTTLGIPALFQSEGLHGFTDNGTIFPSPIGLAASFDTDLVSQVASVASDEAEGLGITHMFAPVLDLSRELRWGRVEENFGEDPFLTGEMGHAFVSGMQNGRRRNTSETAIARVAATYQVRAGTVSMDSIDGAVKGILRAKFALGLFENPYPYEDYLSSIRTPKSKEILHTADTESIVLLENRGSTLPLSTNLSAIALIGPQVDRVTFGDYVFLNASKKGITPLAGFKQHLANVSSATKINFAQGCELWSNDESGIQDAVEAARNSDVAVVMVGTWSLDQTNLWAPGTNATTGEHVDLSDLRLVGAQLALVQAVKEAGKPTVVVFVSGKPVAEPWIQAHVDAVVQQFYPGEMGGLAIAEVIFGAVNPSGKLPVSFPRSVGTTPAFYNYLKGSRPLDPGFVLDDGTLEFGHQYVLDSPIPLWSFGHGLSYTTFNYTDLTLSTSTIKQSEDFNVSVTVHNTGSVAGKEVVQVYITDLVSSTVTPNQELVGFQKVEIPAGESKTVMIPVLSSQLAVWGVQNKWVVEPGVFAVKVGTSDVVFAQTNLTVT
ncbi:hypothetical protein C0992_001148 [Termitomyces sp. T32_za158]|nr:hypothetical protein C0992_001148 [Termitomyces sp. T32_za158]